MVMIQASYDTGTTPSLPSRSFQFAGGDGEKEAGAIEHKKNERNSQCDGHRALRGSEMAARSDQERFLLVWTAHLGLMLCSQSCRGAPCAMGSYSAITY